MSGEPVVIVTDGGDDDAQFAAGVAVATAEQAAETAERAELTAELALDVAQQAAETAVVAEQEVEDDVPNEEFQAFQTEVRGALAAIADRLDQRDVTADSEEDTAGPPAPAPKVDEGQDDGPVATPEQDGDDEGTPAAKPKPPKDDDDGPSYGARSWFGKR